MRGTCIRPPGPYTGSTPRWCNSCRASLQSTNKTWPGSQATLGLVGMMRAIRGVVICTNGFSGCAPAQPSMVCSPLLVCDGVPRSAKTQWRASQVLCDVVFYHCDCVYTAAEECLFASRVQSTGMLSSAAPEYVTVNEAAFDCTAVSACGSSFDAADFTVLQCPLGATLDKCPDAFQEDSHFGMNCYNTTVGTIKCSEYDDCRSLALARSPYGCYCTDGARVTVKNPLKCCEENTR